MKNITLKNILKNKRSDENMTSQEMADYIGISRMTYSKLENGKIMPSVNVIRKIAVALNTTPDYVKSLIR